MPNKSFEELEEMLQGIQRKPAADLPALSPNGTINVDGQLRGKEEKEPKKPLPYSYAPTKRVFEAPEATKFDDPSNTFLPGQVAGSGDRLEGFVAPDYSAYDDLIKNMPKNRDTSVADLISMGVSTGIGALFGQTGVGAANAGKFGLSQSAKADKRADSLEDMLLKLKLQRASDMAKGMKGTKLKGTGVSASDAHKYRYEDSEGNLRTPTRQRADGTWAQLSTDPVYRSPDLKVYERTNPDGTTFKDIGKHYQVKNFSTLNPQQDVIESARGDKLPINKRTVTPEDLGTSVNRTQMNLSKKSQEKYDALSNDFRSDTHLARYQQAASDLRAASASLGSDGELSPAFLLATQRFLGMGMDKGRSLTNDEFAKVEGVNTGVLDKMRNTLLGFKEGRVGSEEVRSEYRKLTALLANNVQDLRNERIAGLNKQLKTGLGDEYRKDLDFDYAPGLSRGLQERDVKKADKLSDQLLSEKPQKEIYTNKKTGQRREVIRGFNPKTKKYDRILSDKILK